MNTILYVAGVAVAFYLVYRHLAESRRWAAAANVFIAKYTFEQLGEHDRKKVEQRTAEILNAVMRGEFVQFNGEIERYGWYALAMNELGIQPAIKYPGWNKVRNPFIAVMPGDRSIAGTAQYLKKKYGIDVSISTDHKLLDALGPLRVPGK